MERGSYTLLAALIANVAAECLSDEDLDFLGNLLILAGTNMITIIAVPPQEKLPTD